MSDCSPGNRGAGWGSESHPGLLSREQALFWGECSLPTYGAATPPASALQQAAPFQGEAEPGNQNNNKTGLFWPASQRSFFRMAD